MLTEFRTGSVYIFSLCCVTFVSFLGSSCSDNLPINSAPPIASVIRIKNAVQGLDLKDKISIQKIIPLSTSKEALIGSAEQVVIRNSKLFIQDTHLGKIRVFDLEGRFLFDIGETGRGPGEFLDLTNIVFDSQSESIFTYSMSSQKLSQFQLDGQLVKDHLIPFYASHFSVAPTGDFLFYVNFNPHHSFGNFNLIITDRKLLIQEKNYPFHTGSMGSPAFSGFVQESPQDNLFHYSFCDTIFRITPSRNFPAYIVDFAPSSSPPPFNSEANSPDFWGKLMISSFLENPFWETEELFCFSYMEAQKSKQAVWSKEREELYTFETWKQYALGRVFTQVKGVHGTHLISVLDAKWFNFFQDKDPDFIKELAEFSPALLAVSSQLVKNQNPLIIIFYLK
ncbi:MAG: 6-bladed beta-propeller [Bacteroidota bacterium]